MSKRKGVSADEKRTRLLDLFYEKKEFFQLKELEKIAPKEKGIVALSVKEVLQGLVDDGLVDTDKIGTSIYFWAFPGKALSNKKMRLETIQSNISELQKKFFTAEQMLIEEQVGREDLQERNEALQKLSELQKARDNIKKKLEQYSNCDSEYLDKLLSDNLKTKQAINRWTENIFTVKSWCAKKILIDSASLNKHFNIPEDLDYVEI